MSKLRVYQLAKELGLENKVVVTKAIELGIPGVLSHSNSLDTDQADRVRRALLRDSVASNGTSRESSVTKVDAKTGDTVVEKRRGDVIRRRKSADSPVEQASTQVAAATTAQFEESIFINQPTHHNTNLESEVEETKVVDIFLSQTPAAEVSTEEDKVVEEQVVTEQVAAPIEPVQEEVAPVVEEEPVVVAEVAPTPVATATVAKVATPEPARIGPKILGRITLPQAPVKKPVKSAPASKPTLSTKAKPSVVVDDDESWDKKAEKAKKKKRQEFSRGDLLDYVSSRSGKRRSKKDEEVKIQQTEITVPKASKRVIKIDEFITVGELAKNMSLKAGDIISKLIELGVMATINQAIDVDTATIIAEQFGWQVEKVSSEEETIIAQDKTDAPANQKPRSPVVTVMGHVDHGKTTLLDSIRKTSVAAKEFGGITQHIGAYSVVLEGGQRIAFIDTPGHSAFTAMRARGAQVTDIVILVVAADDGVMPQTREAINHAKAAKVAIMVAVNKIDKPGANLERIKQQLAELGLQPEDWGGDTMFFPVSALKGDGIKQLLEGVLLQAEVLQLTANPEGRCRGVIIESKQDRGRGIVATVLVQHGSLRVGDIFVAGCAFGKVRTMVTDLGEHLELAGPSTPVEVTGFATVPETGDDFFVAESESQAREVSSARAEKRRIKETSMASGGVISLEEFARKANDMALPELALILKGDVQGSVEAVRDCLASLPSNKVRVKVIHSGVGGITESDVQLAVASKAIIVGFNIRAEPRATSEAERLGIQIRFYKIIYELLDEIKLAMGGLLEPIKQESVIGRAEVRSTFVIPKSGTIAGCMVSSGLFKRGAQLRLLRDNKIVYEGGISSLRRFKDDVKEVQTGFECGIGIEKFNDVKVGDVIEAFEYKHLQASID